MVALRAVVATDESIASGEIRAFLSAVGLDLVGESPRWEDVRELAATRAPELVVVCGSPAFAREASALSLDCALVVLTPDEDRMGEYADTRASVVLSCSSPPGWAGTLVALAVARSAELAAARREVATLRDQLETRKLVERAKGVLMKRLRLSEEEAYKRLQKASQDENRKLRDIAESVLRAEKVFDLSSLGEKTSDVREQKKGRPVRDAAST